MNYETAKKLKDGGFPQGLTEHQYGWVEVHQSFELDNGDMTIGVSTPTLSELIEACGKNFEVLWQGWGGEKWLAAQTTSYGDPENYQTGSTPEEAVANLWLALNTK